MTNRDMTLWPIVFFISERSGQCRHVHVCSRVRDDMATFDFSYVKRFGSSDSM